MFCWSGEKLTAVGNSGCHGVVIHEAAGPTVEERKKGALPKKKDIFVLAKIKKECDYD